MNKRILIAVMVSICASQMVRAADVQVKWLDSAPSISTGVSWGVPYQRGQVQKSQAFTLAASDGKALPLQNWPLAYWPDGSIKWMGFATVADSSAAGPLKLSTANSSVPAGATVKAQQTAQAIEIDTGKLQCSVPLSGAIILDGMKIDGRVVAGGAKLVCKVQDAADATQSRMIQTEDFVSQINKVTLEQSGPVRAVVKIEGMHKSESGSRMWLPFVVRLYFFAGQEQVRLVHTIIYDGDQYKDFIRGLGLVFTVPMREESQNRHVRFSGENGGLWAEPIEPLTGRRVVANPNGGDTYSQQLAGQRIANRDQYDRNSRNMIEDLAVWDGFKLVQSNADGFTIVKRTAPTNPWIESAAGHRALGLAFVGDVSGGLSVAVKNFWQSCPTELEINRARTNEAELRVWLWSPDGPAMDLRPYDTMGHNVLSSYEDVQPGFSTPYGVGRTSEMTLFPSGAVPAKDEMVKMAQTNSQPPVLVCTPQYLHEVGAFGIGWTLPDRSTPGKKWLEDQLDGAVAYYLKDIDQRNWYGFWHYGNVMHTYDSARHVWRYDIGGYAWDNSELVPDQWLWYTFLRTGRSDVFRMAEAMSRQTGEVDCYHIGRFAGLGSRHNAGEWGDGAKEARISQAPLRRFYYYLTTDERTGDVMHDTLQADVTALNLDPLRVAEPVLSYPEGFPTRMRVGPDWFGLVGNWWTEWERTGDVKWRDRILTGMNSISKMPNGFLTTRGVFYFDPIKGKLIPSVNPVNLGPGTLTLTTLMGAAEMIDEFMGHTQNPEFNRMWLEYCRAYNVTQGDFTRLWGYAAMMDKDSTRAQRAWTILLNEGARRDAQGGYALYATEHIEVPEVLTPINEVRGISTNSVSQFCLNAMELLAFIGDQMPADSYLWNPNLPAPAGRGRGGAGGRGGRPQ